MLEDILDTLSSRTAAGSERRHFSKTEDLVGPYELHDFFLYHLSRFGVPARQGLPAGAAALAGRYPPTR